MVKYSLNYLLNADYREEQIRKAIQIELHRIKPLRKFEHEIPFEALEKVVCVIQKKYNMFIREIVPDELANDKYTIWRCAVMNERTLEEIKLVYGISLYEVFAKTVLLMYENKDIVGIRVTYGRN